MKKIILLCIVVALLITPSIIATHSNNIQSIKNKHILNGSTTQADFSHTVFVEYATTTWCPNCPTAAEAIHSLYEKEELQFNYITLISDVNPNAQERSRDFMTIAIPTMYFDGGMSLFVGHSGSVSATENKYQDLIEESGKRSIKSLLTINTEATWAGNAKIDVDVTVTNTGNSFYFGKLRTYINEIESRWIDYDGNPYHNTMLSYAFNEIVFLTPGASKSFSTIWDGNANHNGLTFSDITQENIIVTSAVYHWVPHIQRGYESSQYTQRFLAFYADQSDAILL